MKNRYLGPITAGYLLIAGCGESTPATDIQDHNRFTVSSSEKQRIRNEFNNAISFWSTKGLGSIAQTKLVIVSEEKDRFHCEKIDEVTRPNSGSQYCFSENTVAFSGLSYAIARDHGDTFLRNIMGHEVGHAVQDRKEIPHIWGKSMSLKQKMEQQAECYAGMGINQLYPDNVDDIYKMHLELRSGSELHGTSQEMADAFKRGATTGDCDIMFP